MALKFTHRGLHRNSKDERTVTTACLQPGNENGLEKSNPTDLEGQTRAQLIMARKADLHQRPNTFAQTCLLDLSFSLAVARRTIH